MSTYQPIASITLASAASSVTFSGIPQTYTDLVLVVSTKNSGTPGAQVTNLRFNGDTGSNYSRTSLDGNGTSASSLRTSNQTVMDLLVTADGVQGNMIVQILNYTNTTTNKTVLGRSNITNWGVRQSVGLWRNTAAINQINVTVDGGSGSNFDSGSTFNLYGIANASLDNVAKATGGDSVYTDGTYWYHIFRSSGTFRPTQALTADYLVVAGGGAGGSSGGGGGAGGLRCTVTATGGGGSLESALALTAQAYTVTVGAGGAGVSNNSGGDGSNSVFSTITATGGGGGGFYQTNGKNGGSGGGAGRDGQGRTGGTGTTNQGYKGGDGGAGIFYYGGGGGGGANAVGANPLGGSAVTERGGAGGNGVTTSISSSSTVYGGGGGGGCNGNANIASGGTGGGGNGGSSTTVATAGTSNLGGGGGGSIDSTAGANGGSGIVIVRYSAA